MKPELRHDPITQRPVLMAPERAARAGAMLPPAVFPDDETNCPFCIGREERTPPALYELRLPANSDWQVRVVPNQFPAVRDEVGAHEVIVECPRHETHLTKLGAAHLALVLTAYAERLHARRAESRWSYGQLFKNHGRSAGASLSHAHAQLLSMPKPTPHVELEIAAVRGSCPFCRLIESELRQQCRLVSQSNNYIAITALAGRFPYETWVLPLHHERLIEDSSDFLELAELLHDLFVRLDEVVGRPAYNLVLHNGPWTKDDFHWHFELLPRITGIAGFELGAGMFINPILPEDAARRLSRKRLPAPVVGEC